MVGSGVAKLLKDWRWALRVTPGLGGLALILILFIKEPKRGQSEESQMVATSYKKDIIKLFKNPFLMLSTSGFTCVAFFMRALSWWAHSFTKCKVRGCLF